MSWICMGLRRDTRCCVSTRGPMRQTKPTGASKRGPVWPCEGGDGFPAGRGGRTNKANGDREVCSGARGGVSCSPAALGWDHRRGRRCHIQGRLYKQSQFPGGGQRGTGSRLTKQSQFTCPRQTLGTAHLQDWDHRRGRRCHMRDRLYKQSQRFAEKAP